MTGAIPAALKQQHQTPKTVSNPRKVITYATLRHGVRQPKGHSKIIDPVHEIPHLDDKTVKASHQKESPGSVASDHSVNQNAPVLNTVDAHTHDDVNTPVSDIDRKVSTDVDSGDDLMHRNVKESHENDNVFKLPHASEVRPVDLRSKPATVLSENRQLHNEPKIVVHDHPEKAESPLQDQKGLETSQEQKVTVEEFGELRTAAREHQLEKETIPKVQNLEQESTVSEVNGQAQQLNNETATDDRSVKILKV